MVAIIAVAAELAVAAVVAVVAVVAVGAITAVVAASAAVAPVAIDAAFAKTAIPATRVSLVHFLPVWVLFSKFRANAIDRFIFSVLEFFVSFEYFSFHF